MIELARLPPAAPSDAIAQAARRAKRLALAAADDDVSDLVALLDRHPEAAACGRTSALVDPASLDLLPRVPAQEPCEASMLGGSPLVISRHALDGLDEPLLHPRFQAEYRLVDLLARLLRAGHRLYCLPGPDTPGPPPRSARGTRDDRLLFACRNLSAAGLRRVLRRDLGAARWALVNAAAVRRERRVAAGVPYEQAAAAVEARLGYCHHVRPEVLALIPPEARHVIDVGCAAGALGAALKRARPGVAVRGIEPLAGPATQARRRLDDVLVGSAELAPPAGWPPPDCVVFADVLEHLVDPWTVLRSWRARLVPGGSVVVSLPNVAHRAVVGDLLRGRFDYQDAGVLDRTHLRFFTRETAVQLLAGAGLTIERFGRVTGPASSRGGWRLANRLARGVPDAEGALAFLADYLTVQFLFVGRRPGNG